MAALFEGSVRIEISLYISGHYALLFLYPKHPHIYSQMLNNGRIGKVSHPGSSRSSFPRIVAFMINGI